MSPRVPREPAHVPARLLLIISEGLQRPRRVPRTGRMQTSPLSLEPGTHGPVSPTSIPRKVMEKIILETQEGQEVSGSGQQVYEGEIMCNHPPWQPSTASGPAPRESRGRRLMALDTAALAGEQTKDRQCQGTGRWPERG